MAVWAQSGGKRLGCLPWRLRVWPGVEACCPAPRHDRVLSCTHRQPGEDPASESQVQAPLDAHFQSIVRLNNRKWGLHQWGLNVYPAAAARLFPALGSVVHLVA